MPKDQLSSEEFEAALLAREAEGRVRTDAVAGVRQAVAGTPKGAPNTREARLRDYYESGFNELLGDIDHVRSPSKYHEWSLDTLRTLRDIKSRYFQWGELSADGTQYRALEPVTTEMRGLMMIVPKGARGYDDGATIHTRMVHEADSMGIPGGYGQLLIKQDKLTQKMGIMLMLQGIYFIESNLSRRHRHELTENDWFEMLSVGSNISLNVAIHLTRARAQRELERTHDRLGVRTVDDLIEHSPKSVDFTRLDRLIFGDEKECSEAENTLRQGLYWEWLLRTVAVADVEGREKTLAVQAEALNKYLASIGAAMPDF